MFVHIFGTALWIGGGVAGMVIASSAGAEPGPVKAGAFRIVARLHAAVIGLGALLVLGTGVVLTMSLDTSGLGDLMREPKLWVMILAGLAAGLMVLFMALPTASRLGALSVASEKGELPPAFEIYRKRLSTVSGVSSALAVAALLAWYVL
ncbi:MAG: hypothetical protein IH616_18985 [Gemmatimonadales bacterium]|nr:hypothetical protein [Gemmatimonadales bacterium]